MPRGIIVRIIIVGIVGSRRPMSGPAAEGVEMREEAAEVC
jgi:hypothetical protein